MPSLTGSQLGPYAFTSAHVIWVVGAQKITPSFNDAIRRVREYVLPHEDKRMRESSGGRMGSAIGKLLVIHQEVPFLNRKLTLLFVNELSETDGFQASTATRISEPGAPGGTTPVGTSTAVHADLLLRAGAAGVADADPVAAAPEQPRDFHAAERLRQAGLDPKTVELRADAEDPLGDRDEIPCRGAGQPGILGLSLTRGRLSRDHLGIDIGLHAVQLLDVVQVGGADLPIVLECPVGPARRCIRRS